MVEIYFWHTCVLPFASYFLTSLVGFLARFLFLCLFGISLEPLFFFRFICISMGVYVGRDVINAWDDIKSAFLLV